MQGTLEGTVLGFKPCTLKIEKQLSVDCGCLGDEEFTSVGWGSDIVETSGIDEVIGTVEGVAGLDMGVFGTVVLEAQECRIDWVPGQDC